MKGRTLRRLLSSPTPKVAEIIFMQHHSVEFKSQPARQIGIGRHLFVIEVPARGTGRLVSTNCDRAAFYLRSAAPFLPYAELHGPDGATRVLPVYPIP